MITHKEMTEVMHSRYRLNAAETNASVRIDREMLDNKEDRHNLATKDSYSNWLDEMERLGSQ